MPSPGRTRFVTLIVVLVAATIFAVLTATGREMIDLEVYRTGGRQIWRGLDLYRDFPSVMPFSYPPLAGLVFVPLAALPSPLAAFAVTGISVACIVACCVWAARDRGLAARDASWLGVVVGTASFAAMPLLSNLLVGQINPLLMTLVLAAWLRVGRPAPVSAASARWGQRPWRAWGLGAAAAIKVIPAGMGLAWLLRGRWREAAVAVVTGAGLVGIGFVAWPEMSARYFGQVLLNTDRTGGKTYSDNQSIRGVLLRFGLDGHPLVLAWLLAVAVCLVLTVVIVRRTADRMWQLLAVADFVLLASPISWTFHWTWIAPLWVVLAVDARRGMPGSRRRLAMAVCAFGLPLYYLVGDRNPGTGHPWAWWQHLVGNQLVWAGLAALTWGTWSATVGHRRATVGHRRVGRGTLTA